MNVEPSVRYLLYLVFYHCHFSCLNVTYIVEPFVESLKLSDYFLGNLLS